jgi:hypothetical protein
MCKKWTRYRNGLNHQTNSNVVTNLHTKFYQSPFSSFGEQAIRFAIKYLQIMDPMYFNSHINHTVFFQVHVTVHRDM